MHSSVFFVALTLAAAAQAQQPTPVPAGAPGVVTLSDVARQAAPKAEAAAPPLPSTGPAPVEVPPISAVETPARPPEAARPKAIAEEPAGPVMSVVLARISSVGGERSAVLWIKGRNRRVQPGDQVLQYTVGAIREEGVCLYRTRTDGKAKDTCQRFVTFVQGL